MTLKLDNGTQYLPPPHFHTEGTNSYLKIETLQVLHPYPKTTHEHSISTRPNEGYRKINSTH